MQVQEGGLGVGPGTFQLSKPCETTSHPHPHPPGLTETELWAWPPLSTQVDG